MALPYTPPPTSSPRHEKFHQHEPTYYNPTAITAINNNKIPAQDSYFYSTPSSPSHPPSHQVIIHQTLPSRPPKTPSPRPHASGRLTPTNPIYYSPTNPVPSPHNASRPKPRPGFRKRMLAKISAWIRKMFNWAQENPIKAGILTFVPVMAFAGMTRMWMGLGKMLGKGKTGADGFVKKSRKSVDESTKARKAGKKSWGWGLDNFVGFNGSKGGPLDGVLKLLQMWVTHICRVSPSMIPRTMAILLELYFLEVEKPF